MNKFFILLMVLMFFVQSAESAKLVIFHTNDMHGRISAEDDSKSIGLAKITAVVKNDTSKNILWLDAGDTFHGLPSINLNRGDVLKIQPFDNNVLLPEISGKVIHEMLELSVEKYPMPKVSFLQGSGMTFDFDPTQPVGQRVSNISIGGRALVETQTYKIATVDLLIFGGDGYSMLKGAKIIKDFGRAGGVLAEYVEKVGVGNVDKCNVEYRRAA